MLREIADWFVDGESRRAAARETATAFERASAPPTTKRSRKLRHKGMEEAPGFRQHQAIAEELIDLARRHAIQRIGGGILALVAATGVSSLILGREGELDDPTAQYALNVETQRAMEDLSPASEALTGTLIKRVESGMSELWRKLQPQIESLPAGSFRDNLESPFKLVQVNSKNPYKNRITMERALQAGDEDPRTLQNLNWFSYLAMNKLPTGIAASFSSLERTLILSKDFDPTNPIHLLLAYHELFHAAQDANQRQHINAAPTDAAGKHMFEEYVRFARVRQGERPRLAVNLEATAYAYEMELMDMMMDGKLRRLFQEPNLSMTVGQGLKWLGADASQGNLNNMGSMLEIASNYFPYGGMDSGRLPAKFMNALAEYFQSNGYQLFEIVPGRGIYPYTTERTERPEYLIY